MLAVSASAKADIQQNSGQWQLYTKLRTYPDLDQTFRALFHAESDMELEANDGNSAWDLSQMCQREYPHPLRAALIDALAA